MARPVFPSYNDPGASPSNPSGGTVQKYYYATGANAKCPMLQAQAA